MGKFKLRREQVFQEAANKIDANSIANVVKRNSDDSPMLDQNGKPIFDFNNMTHHKKPDLARKMARIEAHIRGI